MSITPSEYHHLTTSPEPDDYRWWSSHASDGKIVVADQQAIAIYIHAGDGAIVLRQQADQYEEHDSIVLIQPENLHKVISALMRALEEHEEKQGR